MCGVCDVYVVCVWCVCSVYGVFDVYRVCDVGGVFVWCVLFFQVAFIIIFIIFSKKKNRSVDFDLCLVMRY